MYSIVTDADRREIEAAVGTAGLGNKRFHADIKPAPGEPGLNIVRVPDWAGNTLRSALKRIGAWFDRAQPPLTPKGRPIVARAGASTVRNQRFDKADRKDRAARRAMKAA